MLIPLSLIAFVTLTLAVLKRYVEFRDAVRSIRDYPGFRTLLSAFSIVSFMFVKFPIPGVTIGPAPHWVRKYTDFRYYGVDIISHISILPKICRNFYIADAAALKEITSQRTLFVKPIEEYEVVTFYGRNIVASEGEEWKRFRKVSGPAFSEPNNKLVWEETLRIVSGLLETEMWKDKQQVVVDHVVNLTLPIALFVIGAAGFGRRVSWGDDAVAPAGHTMTFKDALHDSIKGILAKVAFPDWFLRYNPVNKLRHVAVAFDELEKYMAEMIYTRRTAEKKEECYDLFSGLLDASDEDADGSSKLTDQELLGNIFIFLVAGHETTAHLLGFALALLALYQDEQEKLYQHVKTVLKDRTLPTYEDSHSLSYTLAVLYETLRLFPPVIHLPKIATEDTTLATQNSAGERVVVPVPQGSRLDFHIVGLHYNPRYWEDPTKFDPSRFLGDWPRDAFLPFGGGARACLGRRFSETEAVAVLTLLVSRYKIDVKDEPQFAHETFEQKKARVLHCTEVLTLTPSRVPLVFTRRY